jgi:hypothetical protein
MAENNKILSFKTKGIISMERQIWPLIRPEGEEDDPVQYKASPKEQVTIYS